MKTLIIAAAAGAMLLAGAGAASAQHHDNDHNNGGNNNNDSHHSAGPSGWNNSWKRGGRIDNDHWSHGSQVDWRSHHLRQPPRGYEWRYVDGRYVMAAVATGIIADIILNSQ